MVPNDFSRAPPGAQQVLFGRTVSIVGLGQLTNGLAAHTPPGGQGPVALRVGGRVEAVADQAVLGEHAVPVARPFSGE